MTAEFLPLIDQLYRLQRSPSSTEGMTWCRRALSPPEFRGFNGAPPRRRG